jgi:crossover junction endodeoxyribonuclease RuvC
VKILGIDPGSRITGYALLEVQGGQARFIEGGVITVKSARTLPEPQHGPGGLETGGFPRRLAAIAASLEELLERCTPEETAVEDLFHAVHARSALQLAHARGVVLSTLARRGLPIAEYTPLQIKKAVSGYGYAGKEALRELVEQLLKIPSGTLAIDASDAVAVALCHVQALPMRDAVASARRLEDAAGRSPRGRSGTRTAIVIRSRSR